jgi:type VI secretion system ImpH/TssG family protein
MATQDRPSSQYLNYVQSVAEDVKRYNVLAAVRGAEAREPDKPRVGNSQIRSQDIVDLKQIPSMAFPSMTLQEVEIKDGKAAFGGHWFGLTGPMGPLPSHLTEFAVYERMYAKTQPFGHWLDVIAGRMLQLYYRAWANSQPVAIADRSNDDKFADYIGFLTGAVEGARERSAFPPRSRLQHAALFASRRSAVGIEDALGYLLRQKVSIVEFQPRWRQISKRDQTQLGLSYCTLGSDAMIGSKVYSASDAFQLVVRAKSLKAYKEMLPTGRRYAMAVEALDAFTPGHLEWDIKIALDPAKYEMAKLNGQSRLGWTSWMGRDRHNRAKSDVHLKKQTRYFGAAATTKGNFE